MHLHTQMQTLSQRERAACQQYRGALQYGWWNIKMDTVDNGKLSMVYRWDGQGQTMCCTCWHSSPDPASTSINNKLTASQAGASAWNLMVICRTCACVIQISVFCSAKQRRMPVKYLTYITVNLIHDGAACLPPLPSSVFLSTHPSDMSVYTVACFNDRWGGLK